MLLDIKSLRVFYGRVEAVHGVDFHVDTGEVVTIIGNNGAGKSSILRAISGVVKGVTGTIRFNGQLINEMNPASIVKLGISQTPEGRQVFPDSTVYENLVGGAYIRKDKQKIKEDIERCYADSFDRMLLHLKDKRTDGIAFLRIVSGNLCRNKGVHGS